MSLIRAQDYLYDHPKHVPNIYWSQLIKTIEQFDQLLEIEKKEVIAFLKQKIHKKIDMIKRFYEYKESIKFVGQIICKELVFLDRDKFELFFQGYFKEIRSIVQFVLCDPQKLARWIVEYKCYKKYNFVDFCQNIPVLVYPYYMPLSAKSTACLIKETNNCLLFIQEILNLWPYSIDYARPKFHSLIDDIIYGFLKVPPILCYVEKISTRFLKEIANCRMEIFAFDEDAIKNEIDIKKHATISYNLPEKKSLASKIKSFFRSGKDDSSISQETIIAESTTIMAPQKSQSQYSHVPEMMKKRQTSFIQLIKNTVEAILNEEPPFILKKMMQFFKRKLEIQLIKHSKSINVDLKHYCYFLLTNFICAQLHNKFTIAHQDSGMTNADLQNISEIIRIISSIFQGQDPELKRYKNEVFRLNDYKQEVHEFYNNFFSSDCSEDHQEEELRQILIRYYESNILVSFNDIKVLVDLYHEIKCKQTKTVDPKLHFLQKPQISALFDPLKKIKLQNCSYSPENVIFLDDWSEKTKKSILEYLVANQQPLQYLPMLRDVFFFSSNLNVEESLEVAQDLKLIRKMPLKSIKQYLVKTANKFTHLNIKDFFTIEKAFKDSLGNCLHNNLKRKECILYYRSEILYQLEEQNDFINFFINELKSQQLYQKTSEAFIQTVKIKAFVNIENNLLKVSKDMKELRGLGISNLMLANNNDKGSQKSNEDYILRNSFKSFQLVSELFRCIGKNKITNKALTTGRKVEDFNKMFCKAINIVMSYTPEFLKRKSSLQNISREKLQILIIKKIQKMVYLRHIKPQEQIEDDKKLNKMVQMIDKKTFYEQEIEKHQLETDFLVEEARQKFKLMVDEHLVTNKIVHLKELFALVMTIIGFTMKAGKVSSDIMAPLLQYIILQCADYGHFACLYSMECLKYCLDPNKGPELDFMVTNYRSALIYIKQNMALDYTKPGCEEGVKAFFETGLDRKE